LQESQPLEPGGEHSKLAYTVEKKLLNSDGWMKRCHFGRVDFGWVKYSPRRRKDRWEKIKDERELATPMK